MTTATRGDFIELLRADVAELGSQRKLAEKLGITQPHLCDLLHGRRSPGPKVLEKYGMRAERVYVRDE